MTNQNNTNTPPMQAAPLKRQVLQVAVIAAILIALALTFSGKPNPGSLQWMILPLDLYQ